MVQFLTLFLGLTSGVHAVELNVAGPVAAVEIRLDGETLATLTAEPWAFECDLGDRPLPHDLVAIARDAGGRELDRARQWINLVPSSSEATLAIRSDEEGRAQALRLDWQSIGQPSPEQIEVIFDGQPLTVTDPGDIPLPTADSGEFHYVSARVRFAGDRESRPETDFGGVRSAEISSELTAVVVHLDGRAGLPVADKMRSWFVKRGHPLEVHGVEKGGMDLFIVRGPGAQDALDRLAKAVVKNAYIPGSGPRQPWLDWQPRRKISGGQSARERRRIHRQQKAALFEVGPLDFKVSLHFISPTAGSLSPAGLTRDMFEHSRIFSGSEGGLSRVFQRQPPMSFPPQVGTAVAMAGLSAHAGNRRRAVLLISAGAAEDESRYSPEMTRDYLGALHVPFYFWSFASTADDGWGEAWDLGNPEEPERASRRLQQATQQLQRDLKSQRVVWLEGRHLPHQIELGPEARGLRLAGAGPRPQSLADGKTRR